MCLRACAYTDREVFFFFRSALVCAAASNLDFFPPKHINIHLHLHVCVCARECVRVRACALVYTEFIYPFQERSGVCGGVEPGFLSA